MESTTFLGTVPGTVLYGYQVVFFFSLNKMSLPSLLAKVTRLRRALHAHPRVSNDEAATAATVSAFLSAHGLEPLRRDVGGGAGLVYSVKGTRGDFDTEHPPPTVLLRADMDALPLVEANDFAHASKVQGAHHACGHDGHAAMMAGALVALHERAHSFHGEVRAVFQPAEETGEGARQMISAEADLLGNSINRGAFGLHNIPGAPVGTVLVREGDEIAARASTGVKIVFSGCAAHASEPHLGKNPLQPIGRPHQWPHH